jgi:hypothetical protein
MAQQVDNFRKDLSAVSENNGEASMSNMNIYRNGMNRPDAALGGGYVSDSKSMIMGGVSHNNDVSALSNNLTGGAIIRDNNQSLRD